MKILVISLLNIGDVLFTTPALRSLRSAYPDAQIDMMVNTRSAETVALNPNLTRLIVIDKSGHHKTVRGFLELIRDLRHERYDVVINLHGCARTSLVTTLCGARQRWGLVSRGFDRLYHKPVHQRTDIHRVDSHLRILSDLGISTLPDLSMEMRFDDASRDSAQAKMSDAGVSDADVCVGLNPAASVPLKQWRDEGWAELANLLGRQGYRAILFGGPEDVQTAGRIARMAKSKPVVLAGKLTLQELAAAVNRCSAFVSVDSGPLHVAASQGVRVVGLYGPTDPTEFGPYRVPRVVLSNTEQCASCRFGLESDHTCITSIQPGDVFAAVQMLLSRA